MRTRLILQFLAFTITSSCFAQIKPSGVRDTTFSIKKAYQHEIGHHPKIQIADSTMPASVVVHRNIQYNKLEAGRARKLDVFKNEKTKNEKQPAILMVHGGGWRAGDRSHNSTLARKLAQAGFVAITVDYRLSTEALFPAAVFDLKEAIRWIRANGSNYGVDTSQIAILGFSAGGELAAFVGTTNSNVKYEGTGAHQNFSSKVQAVIDIDGTLAFIHPESGEGDDSKSISAATYWFGYSKSQKPELWIEAAPLTHVGKQTPPFLFINSSVERMHAGRSDFIAKLDEFGIYSEIISFNDAPHTFMFFDPWFIPTLTSVNKFLRKTFK